MTPTLSGAMDAPLTELMRAAVMLSGDPALHAIQDRIVASVQVLEAVRIGIAAKEGAPLRPAPAALSPTATVVDLAARRSLRLAAIGDVGGTG